MKAAIFDVDGTLLDSMSVWEDIGERYLRVRISQRRKISGLLCTP